MKPKRKNILILFGPICLFVIVACAIRFVDRDFVTDAPTKRKIEIFDPTLMIDGMLATTTLSSEQFIRYECFGRTIAWAIYAKDNFLISPTLDYFEQQSDEYKSCVWASGVKEYMPFPPLLTNYSQ